MEALDGLPPDRREHAEQVADRMAHGSYKKTDYWQKHEATKLSH